MIWSKSGRDIRPWKQLFFLASQTERFEETSENCRNWILWRHNWRASLSVQQRIRANMNVLCIFSQKSVVWAWLHPFKGWKRCRELIILIKRGKYRHRKRLWPIVSYTRSFISSSRFQQTFQRSLFKRCLSQSLSRVSSLSPKTFGAVPYALKPSLDVEQMS